MPDAFINIGQGIKKKLADQGDGSHAEVVQVAGSVELVGTISDVGISQTTPGVSNNVSIGTATGAGATIGTPTDPMVAGGVGGSLVAMIRRLTNDIAQVLLRLNTGIPLQAGANTIGKVDQGAAGTTPWPVAVSGDVTFTGGTVDQGIPGTNPWLVQPAKASGATVAVVPDSNVTQTLLAANNNRKGATVYNNSSELLYLKLGAGASPTSFTVLMGGTLGSGIGDYYEVPANYTGVISGIWANDSTGNAMVTELT